MTDEPRGHTKLASVDGVAGGHGVARQRDSIFTRCNGSAQEVRLCTAVDCPSWPFRMGRNPWRAPLDEQERGQRADRMKRNRAAATTSPEQTQGQIAASPSDGVRAPEGGAAGFSSTEMGTAKGDTA